ncbi:DUF4169 family protein [Methylocapsa palsarum]|uniref:DUF4169 domain-containing protein n=1 Tax=Methylocapsa palsarum TaxID=1612308 RepID=A0A1I3ZT77_9HYPH|nr:DUF4169 family protein [Methylocapsa palsarum]SFK47100.1 protein of unknown function [Methylocapsa palsarum]
MGEIVNLRRARKGKAREEAASLAAANRRKFGATLAERDGTRAGLELAARRLDAHRREAGADSVDAEIGAGPPGHRGDGE